MILNLLIDLCIDVPCVLAYNPCDNATCAHLCVPTEFRDSARTAYRCLCDSGFQLKVEEGKETCKGRSLTLSESSEEQSHVLNTTGVTDQPSLKLTSIVNSDVR